MKLTPKRWRNGSGPISIRDTESRNLPTDLRGLSALTIDAVTGITDIAEELHHAIVSVPFRVGNGPFRTRGITGLVYRNIRAVTGLVGNTLDRSLAAAGAIVGNTTSSAGRDAVVSVLNGVLGDYLAERDNPLAIPMRLRSAGRVPTESELREGIRRSHGRVVVLVHGLCMNDRQWNRNGHDYGAALEKALGVFPLYLQYNTGRHVSENGRMFAQQLNDLAEASPLPLSLSIIAHSMGGLVSRSACHYGRASGHAWLNRLEKLIFLGTPHHGALLEKGGNQIDTILDFTPYSRPFSRLGKIRSSGVTDLRFGNIIDEDWNRGDRFRRAADNRTPVPLPEGVQCFAVAGCTGNTPDACMGKMIGDGLVTIDSALGRHPRPEFTLSFPNDHQWVGRHINHMDLLHHPEVYPVIRQWLQRVS